MVESKFFTYFVAIFGYSMNYKLTVTKSRNARCFYIQTSYRKKDGKISTKTVRKLGSESNIKELYGVEDAMEWARAELEKMRQQEAEGNAGGVLELSPDMIINASERIYNGGDIFIEQVCGRLGL